MTTLVVAGFGHPPVIATVGLLLLSTVALATLLLSTDDRTVPQRILLLACVLLRADPRTALLTGGQACAVRPGPGATRPAPR